ncbi:Epithelial-stromal interaction protein 1 [Apodemus speciosus]|uniref:Epithelial-stromal interaction protein 1 n=1 Tax=Apodemus speciosus TaxID=105296 RepID=A0ABQ0FIM6_APOSI
MLARGGAGTYTLIVPKESRRQKMQKIAEQELADLERWKQQNRAKPVHAVPQRLGGSQSEAEVRQKQQLQQMRSKYQQKLKRDESIRIRKEAEEAEFQKMKAIQREKSNKLEEKKQLQEDIRRAKFREHHESIGAEEAGSQACKDSPRKEDNPKLQKTRDGHQKQ